MSLTFLHILIISATVFAVIGSGFYVSRSVRSSAGYSVAGRSAGASLVAGSIAGTVVGGGATVGTAQLAYSFGLSAWWFTLGSGIAFILMGISTPNGFTIQHWKQFLNIWNFITERRPRRFLPLFLPSVSFCPLLPVHCRA